MTIAPDDIPDDLAFDAARPALSLAVPLVADDVPCRRCGYNLRGLPISGACPECGTAVGLSFRDDHLRSSDPSWVERVRRGVNLTLTYLGLMVLLTVGAFVVGFVLVLSRGGPAGAVRLTLGGWTSAMALAGLAAYAVNVAGCWSLTSPDPSGIGKVEQGTVRRVARVAVLAGLARWVGTLLLPRGSVRGEFVPVLAAVAGVGQAATPVATLATLVYLRRLAARLPDAGLVDRLRMLTYGLGVPLSVAAAASCAVLVIAPNGRPIVGSTVGFGVVAGLGCAGSLCGLATLGFGIVYVVTLFGFAARLKEQAAIARAAWAPSPAGTVGLDTPGRPA